RFVDLYTPLLFYWARRLGLQDSDAADLVQEVFTLLIRKLPDFIYNRQGSFRSWLRTVLLNKWREVRRNDRSPPAMSGNGALLEVASPDPAALLAEAEFQKQLALRALQLMQEEFQPTTWRACW